MRKTRNIGLGFLMAASLVILGQCSPYAGKSMLTFLFDGVPVEDSMMLLENGGMEPIDDSAEVPSALALDNPPSGFSHDPYEEGECSACHDPNSLGAMLEPQPGLCYMCHEDFKLRYTSLHGPVASGYCTACHNPHSSEHESLLRFTQTSLCFYCHEEVEVLKTEMHSDLGGMACMDCHNPHGGEDNNSLY